MLTKNKYLTKCLPALICIWAFSSIGVTAQTEENQPIDIMLVLDNSGSMKINDPKGLVRQAVSDFAGHLNQNNRLGIVLFDQRAELVLGLTSVSDASFRSSLSDSLKRLNFSGKWTDIPGGIERAIYELSHEGRPDALHALLFFTDGIIDTGDPAKNLERGKWLRENLAAEAKQRNIRIFGVAFTEAADYQLIQSVAQTTGGEHFRVLNSSHIAGTFEQIGKRILEPLPLALQQPDRGAFDHESSQNTGLLLGGIIGLALIVVVAALFFIRRSSNVASAADSKSVPPTDFAHLIDVGRHTGKEKIPIRKCLIRIGREQKINDVCIAEGTVSQPHATIEYRQGCYYLRDHRSTNGTFVNGKKIGASDPDKEVMLKPGDHIVFDAFEFIFNLDALAEQGKSGSEKTPAQRRTILRREQTPLAGQEGHAPAGERPSPPITKPVRAGREPAETLVKSGFCPNHPAWKATELCPQCGIAKCKQCMTSKNGRPICVDCAVVGRGLTE